MNKKLLPLVLFLSLFLSYQASALPRFSLRQGGACIDCHVNPTGGNIRNDGGWSYSKNALPMNAGSRDFKATNRIGDNIQFGLDLRGQFLTRSDSTSTRADFQRMTASLYGNIELSEKIDAFARYDFLWGIWEGYAVARILPNDSYIKGGTFQPNFGIRLDDHTAYTRGGDMGLLTPGNPRQRAGLIYDPQYVETGAELGLFISDYILFTASVGNPHFRPFLTDPTYTASLQINPALGDFGSLLIGASFANFKQQDFIANRIDNVNMFGGFAGIGIGNFTLAAEYDMIKDFIGLDVTSTAIMVEGSYRIMKGIEAIVRYDRFDYNKDVTSDELSRIVLGFEIFPYSFIEIRPQYRIQMETPSIPNNSIVVQMHLYY